MFSLALAHVEVQPATLGLENRRERAARRGFSAGLLELCSGGGSLELGARKLHQIHFSWVLFICFQSSD